MSGLRQLNSSKRKSEKDTIPSSINSLYTACAHGSGHAGPSGQLDCGGIGEWRCGSVVGLVVRGEEGWWCASVAHLHYLVQILGSERPFFEPADEGRGEGAASAGGARAGGHQLHERLGSRGRGCSDPAGRGATARRWKGVKE